MKRSASSGIPSSGNCAKRQCFFDHHQLRWRALNEAAGPSKSKKCNQQQPFDFSHSLQQKSKFENLQPLQTLCQKSVLSNLRHYFTLKEEPFAVLPWNIMEDLVRYVQMKAPHILVNPDLLPLFVTEQSPYMSADFQLCIGNTEAVQRLLVSKLAEFSPNLTKLDIMMKDYSNHSTTLVSMEDPSVMHKMVNGLLSKLTSLEELRMNCYVENSTLGILGQLCPKLKHLNISGNKGVTNQGMFLLCPGTNPDAGCCNKMEFLDVSNTGVGLMGGVHTLASLPKLKVLKHNCTYSVIKAFRERHKTKSLPCLQVLKITELPFRARFATSEHLKNVCSLVPGVTSLSLSRVPDVSPLLTLTAVTNLELLQFNSMHVAQEVFQMLTTFSLSRLTLSGHHCLDLSQVAIHCPQLTTLDLQCPLIHSNLCYNVDRSCFRALEVLKLRSVDMQELPQQVIEAALTSPLLQLISLVNVLLPSKLLHRLLDECEKEGRVFGRLDSITLEHIGVESYLDKETVLLRFVAVAPTLREVCINNNKYPCTTEKEIQLVRLFAKLHRGETLRLRSNKAGLNFIS